MLSQEWPRALLSPRISAFNQAINSLGCQECPVYKYHPLHQEEDFDASTAVSAAASGQSSLPTNFHLCPDCNSRAGPITGPWSKPIPCHRRGCSSAASASTDAGGEAGWEQPLGDGQQNSSPVGQEQRAERGAAESRSQQLSKAEIAIDVDSPRGSEGSYVELEGEGGGMDCSGDLTVSDDIGIPKLVANLASPDAEVRREAAHQLRMLAKYSEENRGLIAEAGGVRPLAGLVGLSDRETVSEAVAALLNLSIHMGNKKIMPSQGAIESLVIVLNHSERGVVENAAATMFSLSQTEDNKIIIGASGAVRPLTQLLTSGSPQGRNDACKALYNLSIRTANKSRIIEAGAVPALICFLDDPPSPMAEKAVCVLANLATLLEGRAAIAHVKGGISGLVEAIESGSPRAQENAAAALWKLARHSRKHRSAILQEVVIPSLVAISQTGTPRAKIKATLLLQDC